MKNLKEITDRDEIKKLLIKMRESRKVKKREEREEQYPCVNAPQGCEREFYIYNDDEYVNLDSDFKMREDGTVMCKQCSTCRACGKALKNGYPVRTYNRWGLDRSKGGLCNPCYNKISEARAKLKQVKRTYREDPVKAGKPLLSIKRLSSTNFKLYGYVRLQHEKDAWKQIEIGFFSNFDSKNHDLHRYSQIGTTCTTSRTGKQSQVWKERHVQVIPNSGS